MRIDTSDIRDGKHIGEIVWICHYNRPDLNKKALRNVPPTKVIVVDNDVLPNNKRVYYSLTHFIPLNKDDKPLKKVISPVDNTGFRTRSGNELYVFTDEEECIQEWNNQLVEHCVRIDVVINSAAAIWVAERVKLQEMLR